MPHHETIALSGTIRDVFAHRFTLDADGKMYLADLGPKGVEAFPLSQGLDVSMKGERRPSEIKVTEISASGRKPVSIHHNKPNHPPGPKHHHPEGVANPKAVLEAARKDGWAPQGEPRRKPKHFEVLARRDGGEWTELHIDFAGDIYKSKAADTEKWNVKAA